MTQTHITLHASTLPTLILSVVIVKAPRVEVSTEPTSNSTRAAAIPRRAGFQSTSACFIGGKSEYGQLGLLEVLPQGQR